MARRLNIFKGTIEVISGFRPKNGRDFPLMEAHDIVVSEDGTRLDDKLEELGKFNIELDTSLEVEGRAADAKAVGDRINNTLGDINSILKRI